MASIRRAPRTGKWEVRFRDPAGSQRTKTFLAKADARVFATIIEADKTRGSFRDPKHDRLTVSDWHRRWWPTIVGSDRAANTIVQYESVLRLHVLPHLGDRRLVDLERIDIETWLAILRNDGLGSSAIRTCRTVFGMILKSAVDAKVLAASPIAGVKLTRKGAPSNARRALTAEQLETLATAMEADGYRELILVMGYAGLRPNEAFALRRRHLDDFGNLVVSEGLVEVRGRLVETDGKTHKSRTVPLASSVLTELRNLLDDRHGDALIFTTPHGRPIALSNFRRRLIRAAAAAGLPDWVRPYTLRHACASLMAQRGVPVSTAAALMGHDPAIYLRTYAHLYPDDLASAASALDGARTLAAAPCGADVVQVAAGA